MYEKTIKEELRRNYLSGRLSTVIKEERYMPEIWNSDEFGGLRFNNCYSYSVGCFIFRNDQGLRTPEPGETRTGYKLPDFQPSYITRGLEEDGLTFIGKTLVNKNPRVIACVITDPRKMSNDYHFYRYHPEGFWSHKPGFNYPITNKDSKGELIMDPSSYVFKLGDFTYSNFIGYFMVPENGILLNPTLDWRLLKK